MSHKKQTHKQIDKLVDNTNHDDRDKHDKHDKHGVPIQEYERVIEENNLLREKINYLDDLIDKLRRKIEDLTLKPDSEYIFGYRLFDAHREETY